MLPSASVAREELSRVRSTTASAAEAENQETEVRKSQMKKKKANREM